MTKRSHTRAFLQETPVIEWSESLYGAWAQLLQSRGYVSLPRRWRAKHEQNPQASYMEIHGYVLKDFRSGHKTQAYVAAMWLRALAVIATQRRLEGQL